MKSKLKSACAKQVLRMHNLGFSLDRYSESTATWARRIGEPGTFPLYPKVEVCLFFNDMPTLSEITRKIIKATVEAQQERSARAMAVITGRRS